MHRLSARVRSRDPVRAAVVGAGASGRAAARLLLSRGSTVVFLDDRPPGSLDLPEGADAAPIDPGILDDCELVVLSPGVPRSRSELVSSLERGNLVGEIELASWFVDAPMLGITGTNGKSTTTALLGHLLSAAGFNTFVGGNFGTPLSELASRGGPVDFAVVELSSYQLESVETATFLAGIWLNLQADHLDRYSGLEAYAAAKARLFERVAAEGWIVASLTDPVVRAAARRFGDRTRWFSVGTAHEVQGTGTEVDANGQARRGQELYRIPSPGLMGLHNYQNAAAAIEVARLLRVSPEVVQSGLDSFVPLPHRLVLVHSAKGVRWFDDSKATNVASAATAVRAMTSPTILIAGGRDKGGPWTPLVEASRSNVRQVLAIGEAQDLVVSAFAGVVPVEKVDTLELAVQRAKHLAMPGQSVLLAPACASFDQFSGYAHRGEVFTQLARTDEVGAS